MAGRRTKLVTLAGGKVDDVPGSSDPLLLTLPLAVLVPTRFNPRRNFGTEEDLREFGLVLKRRQLQPAVVVSRAAYLKLWPDEAEAVGSAQYVIANGERRFRGSLAAGLTTLNVVHNEPVAASRADFLDAVLSENNDREDLDPIERALGIQTMAEELGGKGKVAEHYGKSGGWVTQQMHLLQLAPELQALVSSGELPVRETRPLVKLPHDQQLQAWRERAEEREEEKERPRARRAEPEPRPAFFTAVKNEAPAALAQEQPARTHPAPTVPEPSRIVATDPTPERPSNPGRSAPEREQGPQADLPEPRSSTTPPAPAAPRRLPDHDGERLGDIILEDLPTAERHRLTTKLLRVMTSERINPSTP